MFSTIIVAAGSAKRTELGYNKIFYKIHGKTLLEYSLVHFLKDDDFKEIIIVLSKEDLHEVRKIFSDPKIKYVIGGSTRQKSVFNGLSLVNEEYVFIHDGARPNINKEIILDLKEKVKNRDAVILYTKVKDSVVKYYENEVSEYLNRDEIGFIQTPQVFRSDLMKKAHSQAINNKNFYTDDASLFMKELKKDIYLVENNDLNIKATTKLDLMLLEELLW